MSERYSTRVLDPINSSREYPVTRANASFASTMTRLTAIPMPIGTARHRFVNLASQVSKVSSGRLCPAKSRAMPEMAKSLPSRQTGED